jgi:hypothetical protein
VRSLGVLVLLIALVTGLGAACGGGGGEIDLSDVDEVMAHHLDALTEAGKVFHARAVWAPEREDWIEVEEAWLDFDNGRFRHERWDQLGSDTTDFWVVIGSDWTTTSYKSTTATQWSDGMTPQEGEDGFDNFAYFGFEYLPILISSSAERVVSEGTVEGRPVVLVEAEWLMEPGGDWSEGATVTLTVALEKSSLLPVQMGSKLVAPEGEGHTYGPFTFETAEFLAPDDVPPDIFSPESVRELVGPE